MRPQSALRRKETFGQALVRAQESLPLPVLPGNRDLVRVHTNHIPIQETRAPQTDLDPITSYLSETTNAIRLWLNVRRCAIDHLSDQLTRRRCH
jgi:hypothetical protein